MTDHDEWRSAVASLTEMERYTANTDMTSLGICGDADDDAAEYDAHYWRGHR